VSNRFVGDLDFVWHDSFLRGVIPHTAAQLLVRQLEGDCMFAPLKLGGDRND
jgi:hypothetical protein